MSRAKYGREMRELIELAHVDAEFALLEIELHGAAHAEEAQHHLEGLIVRLDEFLKKTHWSNGTHPQGRRN